MRIILIIIAFLLALCTNFICAQSKTKSSDQTRTIEINNDNGELYLSFKNGVIQEFEVNDNPVPEERYNNYQMIIDDFTEDDVTLTTPPPPPAPSVPFVNEDQPETLQQELANYLVDNDLISSRHKFKLQLKKEYLKVNGKKLSNEFHQACLDLFEDVYGHRLNRRSEVKIKKSKKNSSSSIRIEK